ncbi:5'-nucleotidase C-terminal domain-containing protein [Paenibacillus sediminis]|uniref:2',3'-cyclic-nucleotide 2'-phosphodiesterase (5'-nucleotidase family) n=1 Tax=Paenibacillus sediminis TaxID=664909 RepID=A0ABS4H4H0_9BACL|nr:5'-nucleotidase C-terminal domain-containing protein [Paenibacillus sediminis]MBP1937356.1 2',3'-cyclic-nucleotide 2'-phosphodiesterase (5'-nucleotidase family) [Paenibacillus sediminis]
MFARIRFLFVLLLIFLTFSSLGTALAEEVPASNEVKSSAVPPTGTHITILHTNDMHARSKEASPEMGFAKLAGIIQDYRGKNANTLLLDAGDAVHGTTFATLVEGESVVKVMNEMGYDAIAPGNHEFNYGYKRLVELSKMLSFPMISANVRTKDGNTLFEPYIIKEVGGVKFGILGLTTPETTYKTNPKNVEDLTFTDPSEEAKAIVSKLRGQVDVVIALAHLGMDASSKDTSLKLAKDVPGIDIIVDGHSHTVLQNGLSADHGTLIASAGEYTKYIGVIDLWVDKAKMTKKEATLIDEKEAANIKPDAKIAELVDSISKSQEPLLSEVVGETAVKLEGTRELVRAGETNLGNLITDALRDISGADVALTNGGGIRASIDTGTVTKGDIITVLPFGNQIVTLKVSGADLLAALENGASDYPNPKGGFAHVSGMTYKIDASKPKGSRVHSVLVGGKVLDVKATYLLATNDFIAAGGDEYTMFTKYTQAGLFGSMDEAVIAYMKKLGKVNIATEGRISEGKAPVAPVQNNLPESTPLPQPQTKPEPSKNSTTPAKPALEAQVYVVKTGDSLWSIARKYGTTWQMLRDLNHLKNPNLIYPGQKIILPNGA